MKRIAYVTGATGCVGRNIVNELLNQNWEVVVLHRKGSKTYRLNGCDVTFKEVNLYDINSLRVSIPKGVDALFHAAGNTSYWKSDEEDQWKDNVLSTENLLHVAFEKGVKKFVFTSTAATYDYQDTDEDSALNIKSSYVRTKRLAELEIQKWVEFGLDVVTINPCIVVGAYDYNSYSRIFVEVKAKNLTRALPGFCVFCCATDVAKAHVSAVDNGKTGEKYFLGGPYYSWLEIYHKISKLVGVKSIDKTYPLWTLYCAAHYLELVSYFTKKKPMFTVELISLLNAKVKSHTVVTAEYFRNLNDLGYHSESVDHMLRECHQWMLKEDMIPL